MNSIHYPLLVFLLLTNSLFAQQEEKLLNGGIAENWVKTWGEKWWERYHPNVDAQYPGGRSNLNHDLYIEEALKENPSGWEDWKVSNQDWLFEGKWFAVEWFYEATQTETGKRQIESTLAFGKIEEDHLIIWIEYFDDMVGRYQSMGAMKLFDKEKDIPFPWPKETGLKRRYRP